MAIYTSSYTGAQIDSAIAKVLSLPANEYSIITNQTIGSGGISHIEITSLNCNELIGVYSDFSPAAAGENIALGINGKLDDRLMIWHQADVTFGYFHAFMHTCSGSNLIEMNGSGSYAPFYQRFAIDTVNPKIISMKLEAITSQALNAGFKLLVLGR